LSRISEKLRTTFSRLVLEWGISPRYLVGLPLTYKIISKGRDRKASRIIKGQTYDISETGIGLLSNSITADGLHAYFSNDMISTTELEIMLELPEKTVTFTGETCRYQKVETKRLSDYTYLMGVKIVTMSEEDKKLYLKYITKLRHDPERRSPRY
jgi:c-di-GMP-binding flagellar brake protein YcgR